MWHKDVKGAEAIQKPRFFQRTRTALPPLISCVSALTPKDFHLLGLELRNEWQAADAAVIPQQLVNTCRCWSVCAAFCDGMWGPVLHVPRAATCPGSPACRAAVTLCERRRSTSDAIGVFLKAMQKGCRLETKQQVWPLLPLLYLYMFYSGSYRRVSTGEQLLTSALWKRSRPSLTLPYRESWRFHDDYYIFQGTISVPCSPRSPAAWVSFARTPVHSASGRRAHTGCACSHKAHQGFLLGFILRKGISKPTNVSETRMNCLQLIDTGQKNHCLITQ